MVRFQEEVLIGAQAATVFRLYANVAGWPDWDSEVKSAAIDGAFQAGARGTLTPKGGPVAKIRVTEVTPNQSFTVESKLPLCTMRFEHELHGAGEATRAVHRVSFHGPLSFLFGRLVGNSIRRGLPASMRGLKRASESGAPMPAPPAEPPHRVAPGAP